MIFEGYPSVDNVVSCGETAQGLSGEPGVTYYVMAFDPVEGDTNGGTLHMVVSDPALPPTIKTTVDASGVVARDGSATLSGTYVCSGADNSTICGTLTQQVGRRILTGTFAVEGNLTCDRTTRTWSAIATSSDGQFSGGPAAVMEWGTACEPLSCGVDLKPVTVALRRGGRR